MTPAEKRKKTIMERYPGGFKEFMQKAKQTEIERLGSEEAYIERRRVNGARGGALSSNGGFGQGEIGRERARAAGRLGGLISRRKKQPKIVEDINKVYEEGMMG